MLATGDRTAVRVVVGAAALCAAVSIAVLARAGGLAGVLSWFALWVLAPMLSSVVMAMFAPSTLGTWPRLVLVVLALALGPSAYVATWLGPPDAQAGLIFLLMPVWQFALLAPVVLWGIAVEAWRATRRPQAP